MGTRGGDVVMDPNLTLQAIRELMIEFDELMQWAYPEDAAKLVIETQEKLLSRFVDNFEVLDRWMARGGKLPTFWNSQTRIDRITPMLCCGEPMDVFSARMGTAFDSGQDCAILVWHCSECGHWEPYEPYFVDPDAIVPNCLCGEAMVDLPVAQWDPSRFRIAQCPNCGLYETWGGHHRRSECQRDECHTTECEHGTRRLIDEFNEECIDCGIRGPVDPSWDFDDGQS